MKILYFFAFVLFFNPQIALASGVNPPGVPMLGIQMVAIIFMLPIVVFLKYFLLKRVFGFADRKALKYAIGFAVLGYIIVIPVVWNILWLVHICIPTEYYWPEQWWEKVLAVTLQAPWYKYDTYRSDWVFSISGIYLMVLYFFSIIFVEKTIIKRLFPGISRQNVKEFIWVSQLYSFAIFLGLWGFVCAAYVSIG